MVLRPSQKLAAKINVGKLSELPIDENPFADWSCRLFIASRTQYILLSNTPSLYSCVMYGKGISDDAPFIDRALDCIREFMEDDGLKNVYQKLIAPATACVTFGKALNRKVTGSMNDLVFGAKLHLADDLHLVIDVTGEVR